MKSTLAAYADGHEQHASAGVRIRSVDKALSIVELLSRHEGLPLIELARRLGLNQSTAHHLLATLQDRGFVEQDEQTRNYQLGYGLVGLVSAFLQRSDLYTVALGPSRELRDGSGESVQFKVLRGISQIVLIDLVGSRPIQIRAPVAEGIAELHCTASGKVLLANEPEERRDAILTSVPLTRFTDNTITDVDELRVELTTIRLQGEAVDREEKFDGVQCVAVPVFAQHGECVGVSTVQFPKAPSERIAELLELTRTAASKISRSLGHAPDAGHPTRWG